MALGTRMVRKPKRNLVPRLSTRGKSTISFPEPAILGKEREALG
jgi:hypothetical protein